MSSDEESIQSDENDMEVIQEGQEVVNIETLETEAQDDNEQTNDQNDENKTVVKPKRVVRNPQPKLNEQTLMGPRGLTAVEGYFDRVKFKGKGNEEHDLNILMKTYEYWCHRLFPKYPFDSCIARIENLGAKRAAITHLKRIRMGLTEDEDKPLDSDDEVLPNVVTGEGFVNEINDKFDQLLPVQSLAESSEGNMLSEEQLEQIHKNRERAELIRKEKLLKIREKSVNLLSVNIQESQNTFANPSHHTNGNLALVDNSNSDGDCDEPNIGNTSQKKRVRKQIVDSDEEENYELDNEENANNQSQIIHLTTEQMEKMQQNKEKALKIRQAKLQLLKEQCDTPVNDDCNNHNKTAVDDGIETDDEAEVSLDQIINIINVSNNETVNNDSTIQVS